MPSIGILNPKSPTNIGAILRASGCFGVDSIVYTGSRYDLAAKFQTDTKNRAEDIPLTNVECLIKAKPSGAKMVCVELVEGAIPLPVFEHPENSYYVFGPEDGSLSQEIVDAADAVVYIPTTACLNLAATVNIVLYDRCAKLSAAPVGNTLIKQSRDNNNRLRIKPRL